MKCATNWFLSTFSFHSISWSRITRVFIYSLFSSYTPPLPPSLFPTHYSVSLCYSLVHSTSASLQCLRIDVVGVFARVRNEHNTHFLSMHCHFDYSPNEIREENDAIRHCSKTFWKLYSTMFYFRHGTITICLSFSYTTLTVQWVSTMCVASEHCYTGWKTNIVHDTNNTETFRRWFAKTRLKIIRPRNHENYLTFFLRLFRYCLKAFHMTCRTTIWFITIHRIS